MTEDIARDIIALHQTSQTHPEHISDNQLSSMMKYLETGQAWEDVKKDYFRNFIHTRIAINVDKHAVQTLISKNNLLRIYIVHGCITICPDLVNLMVIGLVCLL